MLTLDTAGPAIVSAQDQHDALSKVDARMRWSCTGPAELTEWVPGLTLLASHTLSSLPGPLYDTLPTPHQEMLSGLARRQLPQVEQYRLSLVRLPAAPGKR
ncbi:hypothetical protein AB0919_29970 [Streptomyces sp. NPDC046994]|uniref:hypothetical protein n=1 Tax=unclassified Streptomyces TaxID=2593676 RepID=UPI0033D65FB9